MVESVLKDGGVNPRKLDQRFELGRIEAIKSLTLLISSARLNGV
jgi:hypothetical protein